MKRAVFVAVCMGVVMLFSACGGGQAMPEATPSAIEPSALAESAEAIEAGEGMQYQVPADLLGEAYNPFYTVEFSDNYTVYRMSYESGEYDLYRLYLTAEDTAENVVEYLSRLVGDDAEESIARNLADLESGRVRIPGTQVDKGLNADVEIALTSRDNSRYEYVEGYEITLTMGIDPARSEEYAAILDLNFNADAIQYIGAGDILAANEPVSREVSIMVGTSPSIQMQYFYLPGAEYEAWKGFFTSEAFTDGRYMESDGRETRVHCEYGRMGIDIVLSDDNQMFLIGESLGDASQNMADYVPVQTLKMLGFGEVNEGGCGFEDESGAYIAITKEEWDGDGDYIMLLGIEYPKYKVVYYPQEAKYAIEVATEATQAKYYFYVGDDSLVPMDEGWDEQSIRNNMVKISPDAEIPIKVPVNMFDEYIQDAFGIGPDALFALPVE